MSSKKEQVSLTTKLKVYINCGGKCGFPKCKEHLVEENSIIGQIAHIKAQQPEGPRFDGEQTEEDRNVPENLIALCQKHHKIIDDHSDKYQVEDIVSWKKDIEEWAKKSPKKTELGKGLILIMLLDLEKEVDKGNGEYVLKIIQSIKIVSVALNDNDVNSEVEVLEARTKQGLEQVEEAKKLFANIIKVYPKNIKAILYLAEMYLLEGNYDKNKDLLVQAEKIDKNHWLFIIEDLVRKLRLGQDIDTTKIDENNFPNNKKHKSTFYRIYSYFYQREKNYAKADEFIEKSIRLYPYSFSGPNTKLSFAIERLIERGFPLNNIEQADEILSQIKEIEKNNNWDSLYFGSKAVLEFRRFYIYIAQKNYQEVASTGENLLEFIFQCYFDQDIDNFLSFLLIHYRPKIKDFERILKYLEDKNISYSLAKSLAVQFCENNKLLTEGKEFLSRKNEKISILILNIEEEKYTEVIDFLKEDLQLMLSFANCLKSHPELRKSIIDNMPDDKNIQKEKVYFLYYCETEKYDEAFEIIQSIEFEKSDYLECELSLKVVREKQAWEMEVKILERLFELEKDEKKKLAFKLDQFIACMKIEDYLEAINIGKYLLKNPKTHKIMDKKNQELLLGQTITAYLQRSEEKEALKILKKYPNIINSFKFIISVEAEVYLKNKDYKKAVAALCRGVEKIGRPTKQQYGYLFFPFAQLSSSGVAKIEPLIEVEENSFVKFFNQDCWFFIGNNNELDATRIDKENNKYSLFIGKKIKDEIKFPEDKYQVKKEPKKIENILKLKSYINHKAHESFVELSKQGRWNAGWAIETPEKEGEIDLNNIIDFIKDQHQPTKSFFDDYCKNNYPFALLASSEGEVTNAIGRIANENKGFINFSDGSAEDIRRQTKVAKKIISGEDVYLDGTSALFLAETGLLEKIAPLITNLKTPQSVIGFLFKVLEKFSITPGQVGRMGYAQDKLVFNKIDLDRNKQIKQNFKNSLSLLEKNKKNVFSISQANKSEHFTESKINPELSDACILAQKNKAIVLTEDYLYLQVNNLETKKGVPEYCSLFSLVKAFLEEGKISFEDYLDTFTYLASYRCRFLDLNTDVLTKAIFGDQNNLIFEPENIRKFNLALTLSENYGVKSEVAIQVLGGFFTRIIITNTVTTEDVYGICKEALPDFLFDRDKKVIGKLLLEYCSKSVEKILNKNNIYVLPAVMAEKLAVLEKQINIQAIS